MDWILSRLAFAVVFHTEETLLMSMTTWITSQRAGKVKDGAHSEPSGG